MKIQPNLKFEIGDFLFEGAELIVFSEQFARKFLKYVVCSIAANFVKGNIL